MHTVNQLLTGNVKLEFGITGIQQTDKIKDGTLKGKSHIRTHNSHKETQCEVEACNNVVETLILLVAQLRPPHEHDGRNDAHERGSADGTGDSDDRGEVVEEDADRHARQHHDDGDERQLPVGGVLQVEGLDDDLAHRVSVEREGEAQREGDDEASDQDQRVHGVVAVQHVGGLRVIVSSSRYRVSAEGEVSREGVEHVQQEDQQVREEHDHAHALARRTLHVRGDGDELHLRAVAEAEDRQHRPQILVHDRRVQQRLRRTRLAALAQQRALLEARVVRQRRVRLDQTAAQMARELRRLRQSARVRVQRAVQHLRGSNRTPPTTMVMYRMPEMATMEV